MTPGERASQDALIGGTGLIKDKFAESKIPETGPAAVPLPVVNESRWPGFLQIDRSMDDELVRRMAPPEIKAAMAARPKEVARFVRDWRRRFR